MPMNVPARSDAAARERHRTLDFVGLRAHATAVGLIQLCEELLNLLHSRRSLRSSPNEENGRSQAVRFRTKPT
jgi:hypothetical protein